MRPLFLLIIVMMSVGLASAQDEYESPLLAQLSALPDELHIRGPLHFTDRAAISAAYPIAQSPENFAEYERVINGENTDLALRLWLGIYTAFQATEFRANIESAAGMPELIGIDYFQIEQELGFVRNNEYTQHIKGHFDVLSIANALRNREYELVNNSFGQLWCFYGECNILEQTNLVISVPDNPFSNLLGQWFPIFLSESETLITSPSLPLIQDHLAVAASEQPRLADAPEYQAAVAGLTSSGVLLQALIIDANSYNMAPLENGELPPYQLFAFGDVATPGRHGARVVLVYDDEEDAIRAVEAFMVQLAIPNAATNTSMFDLLAMQKATVVTSEILVSNSEFYAVVFDFSGVRGTPEQIIDVSENVIDEHNFSPPGSAFGVLTQSLYLGRFQWLAPAAQ